ncbi:hypothetical protein KKG15_02645 [Patescibacteria group bacterium]|nr:hypothetical protein [Patescibacteria group bacterium]
MRECELDHRSHSEALSLAGNGFTLYLEGNQWWGPRWVGSEYSTSKPDHIWWEGIARIIDITTRRTYIFTFKTWMDKYSRKRDLEDFILISNRWIGGYEETLPVVESRKSELVDFLCEITIKKISDSDKPFPRVFFEKLSFKMLVERGFVPDETGQIHLPNLSFA